MKKCHESIRTFKALGLCVALALGASFVPIESLARVVYDFNYGTALDGAGIGASMVVSNLSITTVDIVGQDGSRSSSGAGHKTNIYSAWNALGINDAAVRGTEYGSFDSGEAWEFIFDANVYLSEIDLSGQDSGAELTISSSAFPDLVLAYVDSAAIHDLGHVFVPAGTVVIFKMTSPPDAADPSLRISTLTVEPAREPSTSTRRGAPDALLDTETSHTASVSTANAVKVELPRFISSNMVLQRDLPIRLWGWAPAGETVEAVLDREGNLFEAEAVADSAGRWDLILPQQAVCTHACTLTFRIPGVTASEMVLSNILMGDVWLASGQSNMEKKVGHLLEAASITALSDQYPQIRSFRSPYNLQYEPADRVNPAANPWFVIDSSNVGSEVSAVAYCFSLKVHAEVNVPIGLLQGYRGGTEIETWMSDETIQTHRDLASVRAREQAWDPNERKACSTHYSVNYNGQIHPLVGLSIKGVLWYQGESNTKRAYEYAQVQKALIEGWRMHWGIGDFPFLYVQLFNMGPTDSSLYIENNWCDLRDQQVLLLSSGLPHIGMAVTIDTNDDPNNTKPSIRIHPKNKKPIGDRLGLLALKRVYGQDIVAESPLVDSYSVQGNDVVLSFKKVGTGLKMRDGDSALKGFVVAGADKVFHEATAVFIDDQTISLTSGLVPAPVTARYGWAKNPDCNLYNSNDLPASPFRLDAWPSEYAY